MDEVGLAQYHLIDWTHGVLTAPTKRFTILTFCLVSPFYSAKYKLRMSLKGTFSRDEYFLQRSTKLDEFFLYSP